MDNLTYTYPDANNPAVRANNRLLNVTDAEGTAMATDFEGSHDYEYDVLGNLIKDETENIENITWNASGKVKRIEKSEGSNLEFAYDAMGHRTMKLEKPLVSGEETNESAWKYTYYVRDPNGQIMATYHRHFMAQDGDIFDQVELKEQQLNPGKRIGMVSREADSIVFGKTVFADQGFDPDRISYDSCHPQDGLSIALYR